MSLISLLICPIQALLFIGNTRKFGNNKITFVLYSKILFYVMTFNNVNVQHYKYRSLHLVNEIMALSLKQTFTKYEL